jgi:hypothetical protein
MILFYLRFKNGVAIWEVSCLQKPGIRNLCGVSLFDKGVSWSRYFMIIKPEYMFSKLFRNYFEDHSWFSETSKTFLRFSLFHLGLEYTFDNPIKPLE